MSAVTPKEIAEQLLQDCEPAHWVEIQTCRNGGLNVEVKQYRPDKLQSVCAAYLKAVKTLEKLQCVSSENNWVKKLIEEALREMGES